MSKYHPAKMHLKEKTITLPELLDKDKGDSKFRELLHNIFAFSSKIEAIRGEFGKIIGLTGIEYTALIATAYMRSIDTVYVNSLADHLHLSGAFITLQTNKLAKKGYLTKTKDPEDARRVQLDLTDLGYEALASLAHSQQKVNDVLFAGIDQEQFKTLVKTFGLLANNGDRAFNMASFLSNDK
ncbi:MarR family winged helix-turn-helix transcriptional regulator [Pseudomonas sp. REP124]|uniref:MarR family winged helix-turn-helix transcriptional regulator n=1 Tax=Pseudomonas sp. REP124 TaxID=2875731 RepID=UPI001CCD8765|nr:MarR family winged helix-turn-helix transcriptional regulator [Pseudomonas sp. REP124]MBZ9784989.1 MarR family winged helix-turn-helix transcriptional regulator [Pseudomonas sp. REP124]